MSRRRPYLVRCTGPDGRNYTVCTAGTSVADVTAYFWLHHPKDKGWKLRKVELEFPPPHKTKEKA